MRRTTAGVAVAMMAACALAPTSARASERCVTRAEFGKVERGMKMRRVHAIFDTAGTRSYAIGRFESRNYVPCTDREFGWVVVSFKDGRLYAKDAEW